MSEKHSSISAGCQNNVVLTTFPPEDVHLTNIIYDIYNNDFLKQLGTANVTQTGGNSAFLGDYFQRWINTNSVP